jgi:flagellar biosynthesis protein FlhF
MVIKSFTAESVAAALKLIREEMGNDAVILKTRVSADGEADTVGGKVEVTACIDEAQAKTPVLTANAKHDRVGRMTKETTPVARNTGTGSAASGGNISVPDRLEKKLDLILDAQRLNGLPKNIDRRFEAIYLSLLDNDIPSKIVQRLIEEMSNRAGADGDAETVAREVLGIVLDRYLTDEISINPGMTLVFAGLPGSGKTSVMAKLAAHLVIDAGLKVRLASFDTEKVSAYEEINGYADILDVPCDASGDNIENTDDTVLLIDTPSYGTDERRQSKLLERLDGLEADMTFLVYSLCHRSSDLRDAAAAFRRLQATSLIATHLDETPRWGGLIALTSKLDLPLAFVTNSPGGAGRVMHPDGELIADVLLKSKERVA